MKGGSTLYTDKFGAYLALAGRYRHRTIDHSAEIYVDGDVHTQTIEGFWALMKNGIRGVYHDVSHKWLQGYVDEYVFRYNHRAGMDPFRVLLRRAAFPPA